MAKFHISLILVILATLLIINHATIRLPEWWGIPLKGYNFQKTTMLPKCLGILSKGYNTKWFCI